MTKPNPEQAAKYLMSARDRLHEAFSDLTDALVQMYPDAEGDEWFHACEEDPIGNLRDQAGELMQKTQDLHAESLKEIKQ